MIPTQQITYTSFNYPLNAQLFAQMQFMLNQNQNNYIRSPFQQSINMPWASLPINQTALNPTFFQPGQLLDNVSVKAEQNIQAKLENLSTSDMITKKEEYLSTSASYKSEEVPSESTFEKIKLEIKTELQPTFEPSPLESSLELPNDPEIYMEAQIKYMVRFFINNLGIATSKDFESAKQLYSKNQRLSSAYDALEKKYTNAGKTKEEMIRWIIRQSLKSTIERLQKETKSYQKTILKQLYVKYFKDSESLKREEHEVNDDWIDTLLPFKKTSKNKTMNTNFVTEIFQSEDFKADYNSFLQDFDEICEKENVERTQRFVTLVIEGAKKGKFDALIKYRRSPWLRLWFQNAKSLAFELREEHFKGNHSKKVKVN